MKTLWGFTQALVDKKLMPTAIKVALVVGTVLFIINHGSPLVKRKMTKQRWISGLLTYLVPYAVNIHGQYISQPSKQKDKMM